MKSLSIRKDRLVLQFAIMLLCLSVFGQFAFADDVDCSMCHAGIADKKIKHPAVDMGCPSCHTAVDASAVPHKMTNQVKEGLSAEPPELCFGCHDNAPFKKKNVHPAIDMGCTGCHDPHSSDTPKLLVAAIPDLCFNCHDKAEFTKKNVHPPVAAGECLTCHTPHSSDNMALLKKEPIDVCLGCHADVAKKPHAIRGFANAGHPIGRKDRKDPKRPDKRFYCGSCHNPHSSDSIRLFRYPAKSNISICINCHKY